MAFVVESSPADARSIEVWMFEIIKVINWLSPTDNLIASQWHELHVLWCLSWLYLFSPAALTLALLDIAVLHEGIIAVLVEYLISDDTSTGKKLTIFHDLVVNEFWIRLIDFFLLNTLLVLVDIDVAVSLVDIVIKL